MFINDDVVIQTMPPRTSAYKVFIASDSPLSAYGRGGAGNAHAVNADVTDSVLLGKEQGSQ